MSLDPILWALKDAPVGDVYERAVLTVLAETADEDGCTAFPSVKTIAERAMCSERQAARVLRDLIDRDLIGFGDQSAADYLQERYRPTVYDLLIPYAWFPNIDRINENRRRKGRPELRPEDRPAIPDAPVRPKRAYYPKKKPSTGEPEAEPEPRGDWQPPSPGPEANAQVNEGGLPVTPENPDPGVTATPPRGDWQSTSGVTGSQTNHPSFKPPPKTKDKDTLNQPPLFADGYPQAGSDASPNGSVSAPSVEASFQEFWDSYPRKVGKKDAARKFETAVKQGATPRELIDGARRYAEAMVGTADRYVKHPGTWLHKGCWTDEQPEPEPQPTRDAWQPYRNPDPAEYDKEW